MTNNHVAVIIIHYRSLPNVRTCLQSLRRSKGDLNISPIVVDNAAAESAEVLLTEFADWLTVIRTEQNLGFTGGNNAGIQFARNNLDPDTIVLLNDDATVEPTAIATLHHTLHARPLCGAVVPKIYFTAGREFQSGYQTAEKGQVFWYGGGAIDWPEMYTFHRAVDEIDRGQYDELEPTPFVTGCCVALRPHLLAKLGGFDEKYFLYWEDVELSLRLQRAGYQTIYQPEAVVWHDNAGSSGAGSTLHQYYQTRNRYRLGFTYAPWRTKLFLLKQLVQQYRSGNQAVRRAILDVIGDHYGKCAYYHTD